jgi:hypothetical protein
MANEISYTDPTGTAGLNLYAQVWSTTGTVYNGSSLVAFVAGNWTTYARTMTGAGAGVYLADFPSLSAGAYNLKVYQRAGGSPASTDQLLGSTPYPMQWSGTAELTLNSVGDAGTGSVPVDHDYPTAGNLTYETSSGQGIAGTVRAYLASEWNSNPSTATVRGEAVTLNSGEWADPIDLDPGGYKLTFDAPGYRTTVVSLTVS